MKITIEIDKKKELEKLSALFRTLKINKVKIISADETETVVPIKKGDKKIDPQGLFGIWANNPRSLENIRKDTWQRNQFMK